MVTDGATTGASGVAGIAVRGMITGGGGIIGMEIGGTMGKGGTGTTATVIGRVGARPHPWQRDLDLRLRRHAGTEALASRDERLRRHQARGRPHCGVSYGSRIRALRTSLHLGELVTQRGDAALIEALAHRGHERVLHSGTGTVRHHIASTGPLRLDKNPCDRQLVGDDG
jgi:hypothetical protein